MAGRLVDIVLGAAEDNVEWTVCKRHETADVSTQTSKEGSELRSIVYKMVHGSTTFQLLEEHGDVFVEHYGNIMSIASKMRLDAYQRLKLKIDMEKEQKEKEQKEKEQKEKEQKEKEQKEKEQKEKEQKEKEQKEKEQKEKEQKEKEQKEQRDQRDRLKKKKERMRRLAQMAMKRKTTPLNTRLSEPEEFAATPINVTNPFDF